uniref:Defensin BmKDfsin6 n=1 Tax=Olivierus martensii TaxID=34649 RepID=DEF6_OLIMR|nr:RecName: Full=Defensin BmKDfsin6; Flags: Precursor [Mesobuthus martensii]
MKVIAILFLLAFVLCTMEITMVEAGFGCPLFQFACDSHCRGMGRKGGYCGGNFKLTCICVVK